jgi:hypothetical protein
MAELNVDICPETGICSIGRGGTDKIDLMPDEVVTIREAENVDGVKAVIEETDTAFAASLSTDDLAYIKRRID